MTGKLPAKDVEVEKGSRFDDNDGKNGFAGHFKSMWLKDSIFKVRLSCTSRLSSISRPHNARESPD